MTRIAIRHTFSALSALALVTAFTGSPASAQGQPTNQGVSEAQSLFLFGLKVEPDTLQATPKGLATKKGSPQRYYPNTSGRSYWWGSVP